MIRNRHRSRNVPALAVCQQPASGVPYYVPRGGECRSENDFTLSGTVLRLASQSQRDAIARSTVLPGISEAGGFHTNSEGIRGDEFASEQKYRILAVGGSTTECLYLDDKEAWPYLLQTKISQSKDAPIWVGSIGYGAATTLGITSFS